MVRTTIGLVSLVVIALSSSAAAQAPAAAPDLEHPQNTNAGIFAFTGRCASCHDNATNGAANRAELVKHTPEAVLTSITSGGTIRRSTRPTASQFATSVAVRSSPVIPRGSPAPAACATLPASAIACRRS